MDRAKLLFIITCILITLGSSVYSYYQGIGLMLLAWGIIFGVGAILFTMFGDMYE